MDTIGVVLWHACHRFAANQLAGGLC